MGNSRTSWLLMAKKVKKKAKKKPVEWAEYEDSYTDTLTAEIDHHGVTVCAAAGNSYADVEAATADELMLLDQFFMDSSEMCKTVLRRMSREKKKKEK